MTTLIQRLRGRSGGETRSIATVDDYVATVNQFLYNGNVYGTTGVTQSMGSVPVEKIGADFRGLAQSAYASNGPVFSCMMTRQLVFSAVRFQWQRIRDGKPSDTFGNADLSILERPAGLGTTTQDLLNRMIQDADLCGNSYHYPEIPIARLGGDDQPEVVRLPPEWVEIVLEARMVDRSAGFGRRQQVGYRRIGYRYWEGGQGAGNAPVPFLRDEVAHFAPIPDPLASYRGMSWLTPVIRELRNDKVMSAYQEKFYANSATPNMIIKLPEALPEAEARRFAAMFREDHEGPDNAGRTLFVGGGADATVVGLDFQKMDFVNVSSNIETRIAAAAGVPPIIAGFSKGLEEATYSNYAQARRRFADGTMHPLWQQVAGSSEPLVPRPKPRGREDPSAVRLWYDASGVPFLREDEKDAAEIAMTRASTLRAYIDAGYTPDSAVLALAAGDERLLQHSGLYSVQLQAPGATDATPDAEVDPEPAPAVPE